MKQKLEEIKKQLGGIVENERHFENSSKFFQNLSFNMR